MTIFLFRVESNVINYRIKGTLSQLQFQSSFCRRRSSNKVCSCFFIPPVDPAVNVQHNVSHVERQSEPYVPRHLEAGGGEGAPQTPSHRGGGGGAATKRAAADKGFVRKKAANLYAFWSYPCLFSREAGMICGDSNQTRNVVGGLEEDKVIL